MNGNQRKTQEDLAAARATREEATQHKTRHLEIAGKPLSEASSPAERMEIKLARLGRALESFCFRTNDMHLLGLVRDALDDDDQDAIDQPDHDPEEETAVEVKKPKRRSFVK